MLQRGIRLTFDVLLLTNSHSTKALSNVLMGREKGHDGDSHKEEMRQRLRIKQLDNAATKAFDKGRNPEGVRICSAIISCAELAQAQHNAQNGIEDTWWFRGCSGKSAKQASSSVLHVSCAASLKPVRGIVLFY